MLNTPGYQDGAFRLEVNGRLVLALSDVFYRDVQNDPDYVPPDHGDGLLGPLLGDLLGGHNLEDDGSQVRASAAHKGSSGVIDSSADPKESVKRRRADRRADVVARGDSGPIGFKGIFFRFVLSVFTTESSTG